MHPKKILAIKFRSLGDTILMTAPLMQLRETYPSAEIHAVVVSPWQNLFINHPAIDKVWEYVRCRKKIPRAFRLIKLAALLRKEKYDCVINFHASPSSSLLALSTGAKIRSIHFHDHDSKDRFSTVVIPDKNLVKPNIERDMDAIRALGISAAQGQLPRIFLQPEEYNKAKTTLKQMELSYPLLTLGLGASRPAKMWPPDWFASLAVSWVKETSGSVLAIIGAREEQLGQNFIDAVQSNTTDDKTRSKIRVFPPHPIREAAALLGLSSIFAGNDSGPKHLAISLGTPTVSMFGPDEPMEWHPYPGDLHPYFFVENLPCRRSNSPGMPAWCGVHDCSAERHRCMRQINAEQVFKKCLEKYNDSRNCRRNNPE